MKKPNVTANPPLWLKPGEVETRYKAKFVGEFALPTKNGMYSEIAWPIYYVVEPDKAKGHSHYFALILQGLNVLITDARFIEGKLINAVRAFDDEIIYSKAVHDYVSSKDGSCWIDGGFDYCRYGYPLSIVAPKPFLITIKDGEFVYPSAAANEMTLLAESADKLFQYKPLDKE